MTPAGAVKALACARSSAEPEAAAEQPPRRGRRREQRLDRVLGTPALFATAYGNVGSSIYYALGVTAVFALGLTPLVFVIAGVIFAATALTYTEGTVRYPEAGGSSSFARHAFNELVSFGAAWAQMLNYIITIAISAFFVPHYLSIFWGPLRENPWDVVVGALVIVLLVAINVVGVREATGLNVFLAIVDFATQLLLVVLGFVLIFSPSILVDNVHWGTAPTWSNFFLAIPVAMIAYTGIETVSNLAEEARDPPRDIPRSIRLVAVAVFAIYFTLPLIALSALPVTKVGDHYETKLGLPPEEGGFANDPVLGLVKNLGPARLRAPLAGDLRRPAGRDDPARRDERRCDRRIAHHLLDGDLQAAAGGVPPTASALQDALARASSSSRASPRSRSSCPARRTSSARCTRSARCSRSRSRTRRWWRCASGIRTRSSSTARGRTCGSAASTGPCSRSSAAWGRASRCSWCSSRRRRRAGSGSAGSRWASRPTRSTGGESPGSRCARPCAYPRSCSASRSSSGRSSSRCCARPSRRRRSSRPRASPASVGRES